MKRTLLLGALGLMVLGIVGLACGGGDAEAPAAAAPAAQAEPAATAAPAPQPEVVEVMEEEMMEGEIDTSLPSWKRK